MSAYDIGFRMNARGKFGFVITDGRGSKVAGMKGCASLERAEHLARVAAERLIATDRMLGRRSYVASGMPEPAADSELDFPG